MCSKFYRSKWGFIYRMGAGEAGTQNGQLSSNGPYEKQNVDGREEQYFLFNFPSKLKEESDQKMYKVSVRLLLPHFSFEGERRENVIIFECGIFWILFVWAFIGSFIWVSTWIDLYPLFCALRIGTHISNVLMLATGPKWQQQQQCAMQCSARAKR